MNAKWFERYNEFFEKVTELISDDATVLVIGANDGITADPSFQVWRRFWDWVFIEPNPSAFTKLKENRSGVMINAAIANKGETKLRLWTMTKKASDAYEVACGANGTCLTSKNKEYVLSRITKHIPGMEDQLKEITVKTMTVDDIVEKHGIDNVELVQIDCEGMDDIVVAQVLKSKLDPKIILFEDKSIQIDALENVLEMLRLKGYQTIKLKTDTLAWKS